MCECPEAQEWRAYWSTEAIGERLREELAPKQWAYLASVREACNDVRGERRISNEPLPVRSEPFAELERRRWGV